MFCKILVDFCGLPQMTSKQKECSNLWMEKEPWTFSIGINITTTMAMEALHQMKGIVYDSMLIMAMGLPCVTMCAPTPTT